jgi:hypothetical protein
MDSQTDTLRSLAAADQREAMKAVRIAIARLKAAAHSYREADPTDPNAFICKLCAEELDDLMAAWD